MPQSSLAPVLRKKLVTKDNYSFNVEKDVWNISRDHSINWSLIRPFVTTEFLENFKAVIAAYAVRSSAAHTRSVYERLCHFCKWNARSGNPTSEICAPSLANYRTHLDERRKWYVDVICGAVRRWEKLGYSGLGDGLLPVLEGWVAKGNKKGEAVQLRSPTKGALTDLEFEALYSAVVAAYEADEISLSEFVLVMLSAFSGRRPAQLADLQAQDLVEAKANDGLTEFVLNVPRRKIRGGAFRSEFKVYALNVDNGKAVKALLDLNAQKLGKLDPGGSSIDPKELPLFPNWKELKRYVELRPEERKEQPVDVLHLPSAALSKLIKKVANQVSAVSERTGRALHIFPQRLRRTTGTRAAREGLGVLIIAELLDHSDTQNASVYVENIPEHVDAINRAVALRMAPIAQAFSGKLVDNEATADRGEDPSSRIRSDKGKVMGNCGHFGFCGAHAPIACYTCKSFQAWVHGPHQEVLDALLADNERVSRLIGDPQMTNILDRTILAITRVVQLCDERKKELEAL